MKAITQELCADIQSGSGLGLGLAQRLIELLDGKIALQSTIGNVCGFDSAADSQGTTVQVEVPLRLMNRDHDSDIDNVEFNSEGEWEGDLPTMVRKDKIYLAGFIDAGNASIRRLGKSLQRQLKRFEARLTSDVAEAGLVVATAEVEESGALEGLLQSCSPEVQVIVLCQTPGTSQRPGGIRRKTGELSSPTSQSDQRSSSPERRRVPRFLSPSVVREIVRPPSLSPPASPKSPLSPMKRPSLATVSMGDDSQASSVTVVPQETPRQSITAPTPAPAGERPVLHHVDASDPLPMPPGSRRPAMTRAISELAAARDEARSSDPASPPPTLRGEPLGSYIS